MKPYHHGLTGEDGIQADIIRWARSNEREHPELGLLFHPANGGPRSPQQGMKFRLLGVKPGTPDLCFPVARNGFIGLWMELKDAKGRVSEEQTLWMDALKKQGHKCEVVKTAEAGIRLLKEYLGCNQTPQ